MTDKFHAESHSNPISSREPNFKTEIAVELNDSGRERTTGVQSSSEGTDQATTATRKAAIR